MRVAIAGAGIAGLTSAIALAARGFEIELYERAPVLREIGAGIQLSPNAMAVLERLGVARELGGRVSEPEALAIYDGRTGARLARIPLGAAVRERYGAPYCTLHRADLQAALVSTARRHPSTAFHLGSEVRDVSSNETGVMFVTGGETRRADMLIAADGVHSIIRTGYFRHPGPRSLGRSAWRAIIPAAASAGQISANEIGLWLGAGGHLVHYPIAGGTTLNVVVIAAGETEAPAAAPFAGTVRRLIERITGWGRSPLVDVDASLPWTSGRIALIGDAAHAMAPSAAQGGAQAIEDAWVLAERLAGLSSDSVNTSLVAHERSRRSRVERVARLSASNLQLYELKGVPASLRNLLLRASPASLLTRRLDWLFRPTDQ